MSDLLVSIRNVSAGYNHKVVLENVQLDIHKNDFIGIIGPNGGGKTTFIKILLNEITPFSGEIIFHKDRKELKIGYLPQVIDIDTKFPISVLDVVLSGLMSDFTKKLRHNKTELKKALELVEQFGLKEYSKTAIGELSGGQRQKTLLARAIISNPDLLLLDEPNTYVDNNFEQEIYQLLRELNDRMAILLVTHDVGTISSYVKTIGCINKGFHYHQGNEITNELLHAYNCPIDLVTHGQVPHRVLKEHNHD